MHVDPNNHVLAETVFTGEHVSWLDGMRMPSPGLAPGRRPHRADPGLPGPLIQPGIARPADQVVIPRASASSSRVMIRPFAVPNGVSFTLLSRWRGASTGTLHSVSEPSHPVLAILGGG
jgi:hypothetical protein